MIVNFSFGYGFKPTAEIAEKLNKVLLDQKIEIGENGEIKNGWRNYTADIADIIDIVDVGEIKIVKADSLPLEARLINMIERMSGNPYTKENQFNERVNVHISDVGLMRINEVKVLSNECTEDLQTWLDDGWHIIAVCPQPDQRRPDYIMGRTK